MRDLPASSGDGHNFGDWLGGGYGDGFGNMGMGSGYGNKRGHGFGDGFDHGVGYGSAINTYPDLLILRAVTRP
jgi:hypothetical protein